MGRKHLDNLEQTVGPGEYEQDHSNLVTKERSKSAMILPKTQRNEVNTTGPQLGPGSYNIEQK